MVWDREGGEFVKEVGEVVVGGVQGAEEGRRGGEEGDVLDVRVVFGMVGDEVVDVVAAFPPANGEAAAEVGDEDADEGVGDKVVGDASVAGVVRSEHDLMLLSVRWIGSDRRWVRWPYPEKAKKGCGSHVPSRTKGDEEYREQRGISGCFFCILSIPAVVEAFVLDSFV